MKSHSSIQLIRIWCRIHTHPILKCFMNLEGLNYEDFLVGVVPELVSWLRV
jgi:hypothetical protein